MKTDQLKGNWKQIKGQIKEKWGELTDDDLTRIDGQREKLLGAIQKKYGVAKEEAEKQVRDFEGSCKC